jgi:hypothetical protein
MKPINQMSPGSKRTPATPDLPSKRNSIVWPTKQRSELKGENNVSTETMTSLQNNGHPNTYYLPLTVLKLTKEPQVLLRRDPMRLVRAMFISDDLTTEVLQPAKNLSNPRPVGHLMFPLARSQ